jgi:hypothetical protein
VRSDEREQAAGTARAATWTDPAWRGAALAWADEELDRAGLVRTGELEQPHVYPWSTALRLPVGDSAVWLKSVGPGSGHEPALSAALGRWVPDHVLVPLAVEPDRRLMLLPDGGRTLHDAGGSTRVDAWESSWFRTLPRCSRSASLTTDRPACRPWSPTCWPTTTPGSRSRGWTQAGGPRSCGGRPRAVRGALRTPHRRWRPLGVQRRAARRERVRVEEPAPVLRLGDASVSHPFVRLLATLRMVARALDLENGHPVLLRLRDSFLDVWRGHGTPQQLREQCALTLRVGRCSVR